MSYKIYELVKPEILKRTEPDGYHIKTTELITLKEPDYFLLDDSYSTELEARNAIVENGNTLTNKQFVVLNVVTVDWDGEVS